MKLTLGFSPCPNDTFIFDALIHHKIDTEGLEFDIVYEDVETLNLKAFKGDLAVTKLSYHAFAYAVEDYELLDAGSALGFGVGPMLITKDEELAKELQEILSSKTVLTKALAELRVGYPGKYTTANFLLGLAFPELKNKKELVFSEIEGALLAGDIDLGLIIHENRFTYQEKGLFKVVDLGDYWEKTTNCPIPLGGIVVKRSIPQDIKEKLNRVLRASVEYAFANPTSGLEFIKSHAQEMSIEVMYKHIELYVNKYSVELGKEGRSAIEIMFKKAQDMGFIPKTEKNLFLS
ncbi:MULTISPECIES: menaquinone biosynthesis family protein [Sphingobacterium]|uniref:1,4-dihydroxy-6-naphtoate synthase n=1 Tax=Sphingobacterium kitahiroshimense TaxID=470446 RepID=A0ABV0BRQ7_9SPHI|nr:MULTISPECIES: 1,4-dihydroxy-6-naphthoate synthase [Sphingobacterium]MCW2261788.1 1,4-dihydroxy-6-naphthoate synthase [Sphingobacterium kitahiroshimense]NJI75515.1 1,4-dihydroxy-6-naphthoate synthase [Sphingobacterium sp. B16(2022)]QQD15146.1 1,4-dihydroxy-6-naphthoate synthase [Sphingobacterium sp. UDSM-2020]TCR10098.1 1,4-dihydroxy-6-naphthoate synthase [Sphingobacterium sp. JUb78]